ncbi:MAG: YdjY domain-containing protein [Planctomycetota bacterium]
MRCFQAVLAASVLGVVAALAGVFSLDAQAQSSEPPIPESAPATQPATQPAEGFPQGCRVDVERGVVELDAEVVLTEGWLETLACAPQTKEHESILRIGTTPSVVHRALLAVGATPGQPLRVVQRDDGMLDIEPPTGQRVRVELIRLVDGVEVVTPANQWVLNRLTDRPLADPYWVFAGSEVRDVLGETVYMADREGATISLVSFGSDVLARPTRQTDANADHDQAWVVHTDRVPPAGTAVVVRLTPVGPRAAATQTVTQPATQPAEPVGATPGP